MIRRVALVTGLLLASGAGVLAFRSVVGQPEPYVPLATGKMISPEGSQTEVGSFPANMVLSPDGRYAVVTNTGYRQQLSVIDTKTGALTHRLKFNGDEGRDSRGLYYGLAFGRDGEKQILYAAQGSLDQIAVFELSASGVLTPSGAPIVDSSGQRTRPNFIAGIALSSDGKTLYAVHNEAYRETGLMSALAIIDVSSRKVVRTVELPAFPLQVVAITEGPERDRKVYVSCERDGLVCAVDPGTGTVKRIKTGSQPTALLLDRDQKRLFVANSGSDTISILDTERDKVLKTVLTRPAALRALPGCTPLGMAVAGDDLYVALADLNAVAAIDLEKQEVKGYIPVGWYPTAVTLAGDRLLVSNAKGVKPRVPNGKPVGEWGTYIEEILEGTVSSLSLKETSPKLADLTKAVLKNNFADAESMARKPLKNPGIKHVIYIVKENRTYDQVLGDLPQGNGDPSLTLFGRDITPNQHALAERFVLLDNLFACAEVSAEGWTWSTAGMISEYTARNAPYTYSRGRDFDFEGQNNGVSADLKGIPDVAAPPSGYLWDACAKAGVSYRNYGLFVGDVQPLGNKHAPGDTVDNAPNQRTLEGHTDTDYRQYDMLYADSDLWVKYDAPALRQLKTYGKYNSTSRYNEWKREFDGMVGSGTLPALMMLRLPRDHTSGTAAGQPTPQAMVADNDYALGQIVEAVSHSKVWMETAIIVIEDDAQNGLDHVDCHRTTGFVISPFVRRSMVDSRFYNTDSALRTVESLLGLKPMSTYDAVASPFDVFDGAASNAEPYTAIAPAREIAIALNQATAYRALDSAKMINRFQEESMPDNELNDILWRSIKNRALPSSAAPRSPVEDND